MFQIYDVIKLWRHISNDVKCWILMTPSNHDVKISVKRQKLCLYDVISHAEWKCDLRTTWPKSLSRRPQVVLKALFAHKKTPLSRDLKAFFDLSHFFKATSERLESYRNDSEVTWKRLQGDLIQVGLKAFFINGSLAFRYYCVDVTHAG